MSDPVVRLTGLTRSFEQGGVNYSRVTGDKLPPSATAHRPQLAGRQWTDDEIKALKKQKRPVVVFNRTKTVIDAVSGNEIGNRRTVRYIPRELGDVKANELLTSAGDWFRDRAHADDNETDAFSDMLITGMGWTESRIDFDMNPEGEPVIDRIDPLEMVWDRNARKRNLTDAKRLWRYRTVPLDEAQELVGDIDPHRLFARAPIAGGDRPRRGEHRRHVGGQRSPVASRCVQRAPCGWFEQGRRKHVECAEGDTKTAQERAQLPRQVLDARLVAWDRAVPRD